MDVESPDHLERLRDQPEIKAALLRFGPGPASAEARFERAARNTLYWPAVEQLSARFLAAAGSEEVTESREFYGRPCWLLATRLAASAESPYAIAVAAADGAPLAALVALLRRVGNDYWRGSDFFK